jgi:sugar/nucleoside kinase (ribokinase family)
MGIMPQPHRFAVAALGELVIDLILTRGADGGACLAPKPGGAPGNVAVGLRVSAASRRS